ncbi:MAG TPA: META domain-containing protein [Sphingomicrobium sp.]
MAAAGFRGASLAFLCAACASINARQATFEGSRWRITAINGRPTPPYAVWPYPVWFSGSYIRGNICNRFEAPYSVAGDVIELHGFTSTERGCSNPETQFEDSAFAILHRPMRINWRSGHHLSLANRAGSIELELVR